MPYIYYDVKLIDTKKEFHGADGDGNFFTKVRASDKDTIDKILTVAIKKIFTPNFKLDFRFFKIDVDKSELSLRFVGNPANLSTYEYFNFEVCKSAKHVV